MSSAWQTLNPPVDLARILRADPPVLNPALPPGETELEVIGADDESCAVHPTRLRLVDHARRVLGTGTKPRALPPTDLSAVISGDAIAPRAPQSGERVTMIFRSDLTARRTSFPRKPSDPPRIELDPVMRKPVIWSPPPVPNHLCDPPHAEVAPAPIVLCDPGALVDLRAVPPFETRPIAIAETAAAVETGMPVPVGASMEVSAIFEKPKAFPIRLIGPRLRVGLPTLQ